MKTTQYIPNKESQKKAFGASRVNVTHINSQLAVATSAEAESAGSKLMQTVSIHESLTEDNPLNPTAISGLLHSPFHKIN